MLCKCNLNENSYNVTNSTLCLSSCNNIHSIDAIFIVKVAYFFDLVPTMS